MTFNPGREVRWEYASDTIAHVEQHNCAKGCQRPSAGSVTDEEPGGDCGLLAAIMLEEPIDDEDMTDDGTVVRCWARVPPEFHPDQGLLFPLLPVR